MQSRIRDEFDECSPSDIGLVDWSEVAFTPIEECEQQERRLFGWAGVAMVSLVLWAVLLYWILV